LFIIHEDIIKKKSRFINIKVPMEESEVILMGVDVENKIFILGTLPKASGKISIFPLAFVYINTR
jgi:hypothetical protein